MCAIKYMLGSVSVDEVERALVTLHGTSRDHLARACIAPLLAPLLILYTPFSRLFVGSVLLYVGGVRRSIILRA